MAKLTQEELIKAAVKILDGKKAEDIRVIGIGDLTIIADYFIIADGTSSTHTKSLADELEFRLKEMGREPRQVQGNNGSNWIVLDYSDVVVHIFYKETRDFYNLERLWSDGHDVDIKQYLE
ncbi:MAG: ribosome silencing factor [Oscillospiraceae bacterium]|nr:ribosome silencing factor [Oscillospiraceae bacterium]MDE7279620.1 ribosome silencing factor [Oscillospiraceae bacterium]